MTSGRNPRATGTSTRCNTPTYSASPQPAGSGTFTRRAVPAPDARPRRSRRSPGSTGTGASRRRAPSGRSSKHVLGAVAVVDVPVEDRARARRPPRACSARAAIATLLKQAEAHRAVRLGVVAGRPHGGEARCRPRAARPRAARSIEAAGREPRDLEAPRSESRCRGRGWSGAHAPRRREPRRVRRRVDAQDLLVARRGAGATRSERLACGPRWRRRRRPGARGARGGPSRPRVLAVARVLDHGHAGGGGHAQAWYLSGCSPQRRSGFVRLPRSIAITGLRSFVGKRLVRRLRESRARTCARRHRPAAPVRPRPRGALPRARPRRSHRRRAPRRAAAQGSASRRCCTRPSARQPARRHRGRPRARDDRQPPPAERLRGGEGAAPGGGVEHDALRPARPTTRTS